VRPVVSAEHAPLSTVAASVPAAAVAASASSSSVPTDRFSELTYAPAPEDMAVMLADNVATAQSGKFFDLLRADADALGGSAAKRTAVVSAGLRYAAALRRAFLARADWSGEAAREFYRTNQGFLRRLWRDPRVLFSSPTAAGTADGAAGGAAAAPAAAPAGEPAKDGKKTGTEAKDKDKKKGAMTDSDWSRVLDDVGANFKARAGTKSNTGASGSGTGSKKDDSGEPKLNGDEPEASDAPAMPKWAKYAMGGVAVTTLLGVAVQVARNWVMRNHSWVEFKSKFLDLGLVKKLEVRGTRVIAELQRSPGQPHSDYQFSVPSAEVLEMNLELARQEASVAVSDWVPVTYIPEMQISDATSTLFTIGMLYFLYRMMSSLPSMVKGGGGPLGMMGSRTKAPFYMLTPKNAKTRFTDVAGVDEAKAEIMEFVDFLRNPDRYQKLGAKIPRGALLVGPPGTGKTLLAKAVAGEAGVPFLSIAGSDFNDMFVGIGGSRVRDLFKEARKVAPSIIFIDEIDAIGRQRGGRSMSNEERDATLIQLLVEMDGFKTTENVVVLAGTNRVDVLDKALLRPGRFDRRVPVDAPDIKGRVEIFKVHLKSIALNHDINDLAVRLSALTPGMVGADIANICNEGALVAARKAKTAVELVDFERAIDRVIGGMERPNHIMNARERRLVAYHEAGHAVTGWFLEFAEPLLKVTIVPRTGGALGFAQYLPNELTLLQTQQLLDNITMTLGGRAAEKVFFDKISTGASNDLEQAHRVASGIVNVYGMSDKLQNFSFPRQNQEQFYKPVSEQTSQVIDEEVRKIIETQYQRSLKLVEEKRDKIAALAEALLEHETINHDGLVAILGPRPFASDAYVNFINMQKQELPKLAHPTEAKAPEDDPGVHHNAGNPPPGILAPVPATNSAEALADAPAGTTDIAPETPVEDDKVAK